ncbi:MAG: response regulator transcription factor [Chloroflexi bacterium]|nr:response regulator transcription factor [Chloroflexota bacterium]
MLVDDHAVVRSGLAAFLMVYDDLILAGEAGDGQEAVERCEELQPDVVLMDLIMPEMDGATATQIIRKKWPHIQVVVLTSFKEDDLVQEALRAGAIGYLLKNASSDDLVRAIRQAAAGQPTLAPEAAQVLMNANQQQRQAARFDLTSREKEVLALMAKGLNNLEIADLLVVSRSTVKFHVSSLLAKLDASSRTEAVAIALQNRLIDPPTQ